MSKTHVPNAQGKTVGHAHKSGTASGASGSRKPKSQQDDEKNPLDRNARLPADKIRAGPRDPDPPRTDVPQPQAARGDDDLMSQPQPFPPIVTTAKD